MSESTFARDANHQHCRSVRLPHFDYGSAGAYFVTICATQKRPVFGRIEQCEMQPNFYGAIVTEEWQRTAAIRPEIALDEFVVMPNHFHAIAWVTTNVGACGGTPHAQQSTIDSEIYDAQGERQMGVPPHAPTFRAPSKTLGALVNTYKGSVTRRINAYGLEHNLPPVKVWQRSFYDRIIRDEKELFATRKYIIENPLHWDNDEHHP